MGNFFSSLSQISYPVDPTYERCFDDESQFHAQEENVIPTPNDISENQSTQRNETADSNSSLNDAICEGKNCSNVTGTTYQDKETPECSRTPSLKRDENAKEQTISSDNDSCNLALNSKEKNKFSSPNVLPSTKLAKTFSAENDQSMNGKNTMSEISTEENKSDSYNIDNLCSDMIEKIIPPSKRNIKVIVLNMKDAKDLAINVADDLRNTFGCRAAAIETLETLYHMFGADYLRIVQQWADILVIIISSSWIRAIKNVQSMTETDVQTARYHHRLIQEYYLNSSCINYKLFPIVKPGTERSEYSDIIELSDSRSLDDFITNFTGLAELNEWSKKSKELVEKNP